MAATASSVIVSTASVIKAATSIMGADSSTSIPQYRPLPPLPAYEELKKKNLVLVKKEFHKLLCTVKEVEELTTVTEVLDLLKKYISSRKLFDPMNPMQIHCKEDPLASVFGTSEFTLYDVRQILLGLLTPVEDRSQASTSREMAGNSVLEAFKRKADDSMDREMEIDLNKRSRQYPPEIPYEVIKEIEEILSDSDSCISIEEMNEYEVESNFSESSGVPWSSEDNDSDSEMRAFGSAVIQIVCKDDSDKDFWGDKSSDEEYNSDMEIAEFDKWKCGACNKFNRPETGFCLGCFLTRPGWVSARVPMRRQIPNSQRRTNPRTKRKSQKSPTRENTKICEEASPSLESCASSSQESQDPDTKLCLLCCSNPRNASIVHGKFAHNVVCYPCGRKLQRCDNRCPICRRTIDRVVHLLD